ncbi:TlpA family protein disulfide reductase [Pseudidiomarina sediminum]|uniref:TlpA family protein disulfide reductase n=1 Tax=Pseudidiomarina sediminum TaxID=431675 RepID=UPI001C989B13|nr:TlpA disulfide reductase family protein [Pseudidiomarina sediminum]MBY6062855.1 TlpA family protein disulfide reductase [Pseudidiomarina sediminum]
MFCRFKSALKVTAAAMVLTACTPSGDFETNDGQFHDWKDFYGDYVIVNYFAEWCAPCLRELPELNEFYHQHQDKAHLLGVSFDGLNDEELAALAAKHNIDFPLIRNDSYPLLPFEQPQALPATYIITPNGDIHGPLMGEQTEASLLEAIGQPAA